MCFAGCSRTRFNCTAGKKWLFHGQEDLWGKNQCWDGEKNTIQIYFWASKSQTSYRNPFRCRHLSPPWDPWGTGRTPRGYTRPPRGSARPPRATRAWPSQHPSAPSSSSPGILDLGSQFTIKLLLTKNEFAMDMDMHKIHQSLLWVFELFSKEQLKIVFLIHWKVCVPCKKFYSYSNIFRRTFNGRTSIKYSNITRREEDAANLLDKYTIRSIVCEASCHSVTRSLGHSVTRSLGHSVTLSLWIFLSILLRTDWRTTLGSIGLLCRQKYPNCFRLCTVVSVIDNLFVTVYRNTL